MYMIVTVGLTSSFSSVALTRLLSIFNDTGALIMAGSLFAMVTRQKIAVTVAVLSRLLSTMTAKLAVHLAVIVMAGISHNVSTRRAVAAMTVVVFIIRRLPPPFIVVAE